MVEIVSQIKAAEEQADEMKKSSRQKARMLSEEATDAGKRLLESERVRAEDAAREIIAEAQAGAKAFLDANAAQSSAQCEELKEQSGARLQKASAMIVERIVERL